MVEGSCPFLAAKIRRCVGAEDVRAMTGVMEEGAMELDLDLPSGQWPQLIPRPQEDLKNRIPNSGLKYSFGVDCGALMGTTFWMPQGSA